MSKKSKKNKKEIQLKEKVQSDETKHILNETSKEMESEESLMIKEPQAEKVFQIEAGCPLNKMLEEAKVPKGWTLLKDDKISLRKVLLAGLVVAIMSSIWGILTCGWLFNWVYLLEPTIVWKDINFQDPVFLGVCYGGIFILNFLFAWVFALLYHGIPGEKIGKGIWYGFLIWLVGILPGMFSLYLWMNIAEIVIIYWCTNLLIERVIAGIIVALIYKPREIK